MTSHVGDSSRRRYQLSPAPTHGRIMTFNDLSKDKTNDIERTVRQANNILIKIETEIQKGCENKDKLIDRLNCLNRRGDDLLHRTLAFQQTSENVSSQQLENETHQVANIHNLSSQTHEMNTAFKTVAANQGGFFDGLVDSILNGVVFNKILIIAALFFGGVVCYTSPLLGIVLLSGTFIVVHYKIDFLIKG